MITKKSIKFEKNFMLDHWVYKFYSNLYKKKLTNKN